MKSIVFTFLLLVSMYSAGQNRLEVEVTKIKDLEGQVQVCLFKDGVGFLSKGAPVACTWMEANSGTISYVFDSVSAGEYAVIVIHDLNKNKTLDTNFLRIPSEPYGFSNNPSTTFGPPDFEGAAFQISGDTKIKVELK